MMGHNFKSITNPKQYKTNVLFQHKSGKNTTGKLKCNSEAGWLNDSTRGSSQAPDVPSTPEHTGKHKVRLMWLQLYSNLY